MSEHTMNPVGGGIVLNYVRGKARQLNNYLLIKVTSSKVPRIDSLIGCKVVIRDAYGNEYRGRVIKIHSRRNDVVVVRMRRSIPGQLLGADLTIFQ